MKTPTEAERQPAPTRAQRKPTHAERRVLQVLAAGGRLETFGPRSYHLCSTGLWWAGVQSVVVERMQAAGWLDGRRLSPAGRAALEGDTNG